MSTPIITTTNAHVPLPIKTLQPAHINELPVGAQGFYSAGNITLQQNASNQNDFVHAASGGRRRRKRQNKRGGYINANLIPSSPLPQKYEEKEKVIKKATRETIEKVIEKVTKEATRKATREVIKDKSRESFRKP